jgi:hypothetical protein
METVTAVADVGTSGKTLTRKPRTFALHRYRDKTGVSGLGDVAEGVEWSTGTVALYWSGGVEVTAVWPSIADLLSIHGHNGDTVVRWLDDGSEQAE